MACRKRHARFESSEALAEQSAVARTRRRAAWMLHQNVADAATFALSQDFRKFAKKSKAGADQEKNSKMAGVAEKNPGFLAILQ